MTNVTHYYHMLGCHSVTLHDEYRKVVYRPYNSCISSVQNLIETLLSSSYLSQMATYWFVIDWFDNQSAQKDKVRQAAKDIIKFEIYSQTYSP